MKGIYVERTIAADMDAIWEHTQRAHLHERWDMRFSSIAYLPRSDPNAPQQSLYTTRLGFGLRIEGKGESAGEVFADNGSRTTRLRFWSDDPKSLMLKGSGYWRYVPVDGGIRFSTYYNYSTRYGCLGRLLDIAFRPLMAWATARSFDVLALWLERGIVPERAGLRPRLRRLRTR